MNDISVLCGGMKLVTNVHKVYGHCWNVVEVKDQCHLIMMSANCTMIIRICTRQRAPSSMYKSANAIMAWRSTLLRGGFEAHFFYSASALLTMQSAVLAGWIPSVCPYVRLSFRHIPVFCPDEWRYDRAVSASGRTIILVSIKFIRIFAGDQIVLL